MIEPRGEEMTDRNVFGRLAARDFFDAARGAGMEISGPAPYTAKDRRFRFDAGPRPHASYQGQRSAETNVGDYLRVFVLDVGVSGTSQSLRRWAWWVGRCSRIDSGRARALR